MRYYLATLVTVILLSTLSVGPANAQVNRVESIEAEPGSWSAKVDDLTLIRIKAILTDGTRRDITKMCSWEIFSEKPVVANDPDLNLDWAFVAVGPGNAIIEVTYEDPLATDPFWYPTTLIQVEVVDTATGVEFTPGDWLDAAMGDVEDFEIWALYPDGTRHIVLADNCEWNFNGDVVAAHGNWGIAGSFEAVGPGETSMVVQCWDPRAGADVLLPVITIPVTVGTRVIGLAVEPPRWNATTGEVQEFEVIATYSDGSVAHVQQSTNYSWDNSMLENVIPSGPTRLFFKAVAPGTTEIVVEYSKPEANSLEVIVPVTISTSSAITTPPLTSTKPMSGISIGISADPDKSSYEVGETVRFTEAVLNENPQNRYAYNWTVDGRSVATGPTFTYTFTEPGQHYVQLEVDSSDPAEDDAIIMNIGVAYPPGMSAAIRFDPPNPPYAIGSFVGLEAVTVGATDITEFRWYVGGKYIGSGQQGVRYRITESGEHEVRLGLRRGSNFDEVSETRTLVVGEPGVGTLGRERNRFDAVGAPDQLKIRSSYWRGGSGDWSEPISFNGGSIGAVDQYVLHTGTQADGYNTGFLVYVPRGRNEIKFKVFHFSWSDAQRRAPQGKIGYSGNLPSHAKTVMPESLSFSRAASRMGEVEWRTEDGSSCRARINKFAKSGTIRYSGMEDLGCVAGIYPPVEEPIQTLAEALVSGTYQASVWAGRGYESQWQLTVKAGRVNGRSQWSCCPGPRVDPMRGGISGKSVTIERDCTGQGYNQDCLQIYTGELEGDTVRGSFTHNGQPAGSWTLDLRSRNDSAIADAGSGAIPAHDVTGRWSITQSNGYRGTLDFSQDSTGRLTGTASFDGGLSGTITGTVSGDALDFTITYSGGLQGGYSGTLSASGTTMTSGSSQSTSGEAASWQATR